MQANVDLNPGRDASAPAIHFIEYGSIIFLLLVTFVTVGSVIFYSQFGFDQTDEGFYLNSIANPHYYRQTITQFGYIYHPIYLMVDGSVSALRNFNYLSTYFSSVILSFFVLKNNFSSNAPRSDVTLLLFSFIIGSASLVLTCFELPQSPSYNTLAFQSLIIGALGISLTYSRNGNMRFIGDIVIGFSWWLAFMAKPTTALALGFLSMLSWVFSKRSDKSAFLAPSFTALTLVIISALAIDGSVILFVNNYISSIELGKLLGAGNNIASIWRWDGFPLSGGGLHLLIIMGLALLLYFYILSHKGGALVKIELVACALVAIVGCTMLLRFYPAPQERYSGLIFLAVPMGGLAYLLFDKLQSPSISFSKDRLVFAALMSMMPFAYAFGTDRPYWLNAEGASLFWVLSGVVLVADTAIGRMPFRALIPISALTCLMALFFISASIEYPMRQTAALRVMDKLMTIGPENSQIIVSSDYFEYLDSLKQYAKNGEFKHGTPVIDLTGSSPGVVYALGGVAPGTPWLLGGYPGSDRYASAVLDRVSCIEIAHSWILFSPTQAGMLSIEILDRYGLNLNNDYEDLGFATRPPTPFPDSYPHHLLKPKRSFGDAISVCEAKRISRIGIY